MNQIPVPTDDEVAQALLDRMIAKIADNPEPIVVVIFPNAGPHTRYETRPLSIAVKWQRTIVYRNKAAK